MSNPENISGVYNRVVCVVPTQIRTSQRQNATGIAIDCNKDKHRQDNKWSIGTDAHRLFGRSSSYPAIQ